MKKTLIILCFIALLALPSSAQINDSPQGPFITQPIINAIGMNPYNAPYNQNPALWFIVDQVSPSLSTCLSSNFSTCFPGGIRFRVDSILAGSINLSGTVTTSLSPGNVCVLSGGVLTTSGCTGVTTLNGLTGGLSITGGTGISVTVSSPNITITPTGFSGSCAPTTTLIVVNGLITGCS